MAQERKPKVNQGPGARRAMGPRPAIKNPGKLFKRLMAYILKGYAPHCIIAVVCIAASVFASTQGTMFMRTLIDGYIEPMLGALASGKAAPDRKSVV